MQEFDLEKFIDENQFYRRTTAEDQEPEYDWVVTETALRQALAGKTVIDNATHVAIPKRLVYMLQPDYPDDTFLLALTEKQREGLHKDWNELTSMIGATNAPD